MKKMALITLATLLTVQSAFAGTSVSVEAFVNHLAVKMETIVSAGTSETQKNEALAKVQASVASLPASDKIKMIDALVLKLSQVESIALRTESDKQGMLTFIGLTLAGFMVISLLPYNTKAGLIGITATMATFGAFAYNRQYSKVDVKKNAAELTQALLNMKAALQAEQAAEALN